MKYSLRSTILNPLILIIGLCPIPSIAATNGQQVRKQLPPTATGRTGPVGLKLTLLRDRIKVGESLFVKMTLTNFSNDPLPVADWIYRGSDRLDEAWVDVICDSEHPAIEVRDSKGNRLKPFPYFNSSGSDSPLAQTVGQPQPDARLKQWKSEGLSDAQINERFQDETVKEEDANRDKKYPGIILKHGQSVETASWCSGRVAGKSPTTITCPGDGFVELAIYTFERPGRYRIRSVRDFRPGTKLQRELADQWDVRTATNWITFEVTR